MIKHIWVDVKKCTGCKSCELACAVEHSETKNLETAIFEEKLSQTRIIIENASGLPIPMQCRQCEDAPCVKVCPSKALERPSSDTPVLIHTEKCIGCKYCIIACPFGVIKMNREEKAITKCDLCFERVKTGKLPACVEICPTKALKFKTPAEESADIRKTAANKFLVDYVN